MKIGMYTIEPWRYDPAGQLKRAVIDEDLSIYAGSFILRNSQEGWYVDFHYDVFQLEYRLMYDQFIYKYFPSREDAMRHVDEFLKKLFKLKAFL